MVRKSSLLILSSLCAFLFALAADSRQARYLTFTAKNEDGIYLRDLKLKEVALFVDGEPIEVRYLGYRNVETAFVFIIENSPRTAPYAVSLPHFGQVNTVDQTRYFLMNGFFLSVVETGPVLVAEFYQDLKIVQEFTRHADVIEYALAQMQPNFAGLDKENIPIGRMLGRGVDLLKDRPEKRKILVFFTVTVDRESYKYMEEYQDMLRMSDVELYVISFALRLPSGPGFTHEERMNHFFFERLVDETAGQLYVSGEYVYIHEFMDDLMSRLSNSYTIGFYVEAEPEPRSHAVRLAVRDQRMKVTHRQAIVY